MRIYIYNYNEIQHKCYNIILKRLIIGNAWIFKKKKIIKTNKGESIIVIFHNIKTMVHGGTFL